MNIEFCVVTYHSGQTLDRLLRSVSTLVPQSRMAIHDNTPGGIDANLADRLGTKHGLTIRTEVCSRNCGFARANNSLANSSSADLLAFLNPDAELISWPKLWPSEQRCLYGARLIDANGRLTGAWGRKRSLWSEASRRWIRRQPALPKGRGYVSGAALALFREDFLRLDGFDERFFMYYEDIDLCWRANAMHMPVAMLPDWVVRHEGGHSARHFPAVALIRSYDSGRLFHAKMGHSVRVYDYICWADALVREAYFSALGPRQQGSIWRQLRMRVAAVIREG